MKKINLSLHALKRIKERDIDIELAKLAIKETLEVIDVKFGRKACYRMRYRPTVENPIY
jgi:hypothetical protein